MNTIYYTDEDYAMQRQLVDRFTAPRGVPGFTLKGKHGMTHEEVVAANTAAQRAFHNGMHVRIVSTEIRGRVIGACAGMVEVATRDGHLCWPREWVTRDSE